MAFKFTAQPLVSGLYEPEGIYLSTPFEARSAILQFWGENAEFYSQYTYNSVTLKGHVGLDFALQPGARILAVDLGRVIELSEEPGGFGRYLKVEHAWGESLYANLDELAVDAGQEVRRGAFLGTAMPNEHTATEAHFHFGIRIKPFNRFDGWGGFTDPLPFLSSADLRLLEEDLDDQGHFAPHPMLLERLGMRRP